jgi:prepilin-type N-terminal cleavage/methylation domain-containing protein/prepilin-type processing-associated H-X9-DG protein
VKRGGLQTSRQPIADHRRWGFTLIELLVVMAIIGVLISLLLPAIQAAREAARRSSCCVNLSQVALAIQHYEAAHEVFPAGTMDPARPIQQVPAGYHHNWIVRILPFLDEPAAFRNTDFSVGVYAPQNAKVSVIGLRVLVCPSDPGAAAPATNYAGCHNDVETPIDETNNGAFIQNVFLPYESFTDGTSHTLFVGEKINGSAPAVGPAFPDFGWMSGTRSSLRNMGSGINGGTPILGPGGIQLEMPEFPMQGFVMPPPGVTAAPVDPFGGSSVPPPDTLPAGPATTPPPDSSQPPPSGGQAAPAGQAPRKLTPNLFVGGFGSFHPGGCNFALGDGSVRYIIATSAVLQLMAHRSDGALADLP